MHAKLRCRPSDRIAKVLKQRVREEARRRGAVVVSHVDLRDHPMLRVNSTSARHGTETSSSLLVTVGQGLLSGERMLVAGGGLVWLDGQPLLICRF